MQKITLTNDSTGRSVFLFNEETVLLDCGDTAMVAPATSQNIEIGIGPEGKQDICTYLERERTESEHLHGLMDAVKEYKFEYKTLIRYIAIELSAGYYFDMVIEAMDNSNRFSYPLEGTVNADDTYGSVGIYIGNYASKNIEDKYFDVLSRMKEMVKSGDRSNYYDLRTEFVEVMDNARTEFAKHGITA